MIHYTLTTRSSSDRRRREHMARFYGPNRASDASLFIRALPAVAEFNALACECECRIQVKGTVYTLTAWRAGKRYEAECGAPDLLFALGELGPRVRRLVEAGPVPVPVPVVGEVTCEQTCAFAVNRARSTTHRRRVPGHRRIEVQGENLAPEECAPAK